MRILFAFLLICGSWMPAAAQALQPGDTIAVSVYQDSKLDRQIVVGPSGHISFPLAGQIRAEGMTPQSLEKTLRSKLRDKYAGSLDITVSLVATAKLDERAEAEVLHHWRSEQARTLSVAGWTNVVQAIAMSGGLGQFAARKRIQVRRKVNGVEATLLFDYAAFEAGKEVAGNIDLQAGDVIIIPEKGFWE